MGGRYLSLKAHLVTLQVLSDSSLLHQLAPHLIHLSHTTDGERLHFMNKFFCIC